jgi:putative ABC transport system substrate-binding protein
MKRRNFLGVLGGAATVAWPAAARAEQAAIPVIGLLTSVSPQADWIAEFSDGLSQQGFFEGRNLAIERRDADGRYERLPILAAQLSALSVAVIVALPSSAAAIAANAATQKIPIVFHMGADPVRLGLIGSYNRPGGNLTGVSSIVVSLTAKRLEMLNELLPKSARIAELVNPKNQTADEEVRLAQTAARTLGRDLIVVYAATETEIDGVFEALARQKIGGLVVWQEAYFRSRRDQIVSLARLYEIPAIYGRRLFADAGGFMSYGPKEGGGYRQIGIYVGMILKGAKPADLPVVQASKFELVINLKTAKALGITIPPQLLAVADEVIE